MQPYIAGRGTLTNATNSVMGIIVIISPAFELRVCVMEPSE